MCIICMYGSSSSSSSSNSISNTTLWAYHTDIAWHTSLPVNSTAHQSKLHWCLTVLVVDVQSTLCTHRCCTFETVISGPCRPRHSTCAVATSACVVWQSGKNFHRTCKAQTIGDILSVALSASCSSVRTAGGTSDRCWLKARRTGGLTYFTDKHREALLRWCGVSASVLRETVLSAVM